MRRLNRRALVTTLSFLAVFFAGGCIEGPPGPPGEQGIQGERGAQGERGEQGVQGEPGLQGERGEQGIQGERGAQGERGEQGVQGERGLQGEQGARGLRGERGLQGLQGERGPQGPKGDKGDAGSTAEPSTPGWRWTPAPGIPSNPGDWTYSGPECPDGFLNCVSFQRNQWLSLDSEGSHTDKWIGNGRRLSMICDTFDGDLDLTFYLRDDPDHRTELSRYGVNLSITVGDNDPVVFHNFKLPTWDRTAIRFEGAAAVRPVTALIADAESKDVPMQFKVTGDGVLSGGATSAWEDFDVTGFATNYQRLVCDM